MPALPSSSSLAPLASQGQVPASRFSGFNLSAMWSGLCRPWLGMHQWPVLAWLNPVVPVCLLSADGGASVWLGDRIQKKEVNPSAVSARFFAVELPEELLLRRKLQLPTLSDADLAHAVELELRSISPFAVNDFVWGFRVVARAQDTLAVETILTSRRQVQQYVEDSAARLPRNSSIEAWALSLFMSHRGLQGIPIVLNGFGEKRRQRFAVVRRGMAYGLLGLALCFAVAMAVTPTLQLRLRAIEAKNEFQAASRRVEALTRHRTALMQSADRISALNSVIAESVDPLQVIDTVTRSLPDDVYLLGMQVQGSQINLNGMAANAAGLMQTLSAQPGLRDVKSPTAAIKHVGTVKESFAIELTLSAPVPLTSALLASTSTLPAAVTPTQTSTAVLTVTATVKAPPANPVASAPLPALKASLPVGPPIKRVVP